MNKKEVIIKTAKGTIKGETEKAEKELQKEIESLSEKELKTVCAAIEAGYTDIDECLSDLKNEYIYLTGAANLEEEAEDQINCEEENVPDWIKRYVNIEMLANDLVYDNYYETKYGVLHTEKILEKKETQ